MKNDSFVKGVSILAKYVMPENYDLESEHDQIWFGRNCEDVSEEDRTELESLGWFVDDDVQSWSCFT